MSYLWTRGCCCVSSSIVGEVNWSLPSSKQVEIDKALVSWGRVKLLRAIHTSGSKVEGVKHKLWEWTPAGRVNVFVFARDS